MFARALLASVVRENGDIVVVHRNDWGTVFGRSWNPSEEQRDFSGVTVHDLGEILFRDLDEPSGPGHVHVDRARGLADDPASVCWLDTE